MRVVGFQYVTDTVASFIIFSVNRNQVMTGEQLPFMKLFMILIDVPEFLNDARYLSPESPFFFRFAVEGPGILRSAKQANLVVGKTGLLQFADGGSGVLAPVNYANYAIGRIVERIISAFLSKAIIAIVSPEDFALCGSQLFERGQRDCREEKSFLLMITPFSR
jgi:hypothetical protein